MGLSASTTASTANMSLALQAGGAATGAIGSYYSSQAQASSLGYQAGMADINAHQAELGAQQELFKGNAAVAQVSQRAGQVKGAQRATMAANGIDLGSATANDVLTSTDVMKENDINTITANAVRSAWGYRTQGTNFQNDAATKRSSASSINPLASGAVSLLGGAGGVASSYYTMSKAGAFGGGGAASGAYLPDSLRGGA